MSGLWTVMVWTMTAGHSLEDAEDDELQVRCLRHGRKDRMVGGGAAPIEDLDRPLRIPGALDQNLPEHFLGNMV